MRSVWVPISDASWRKNNPICDPLMKPRSLLVALSVAMSTLITSLQASGDHPDLQGQVLHDDGSPVAKATVFIYTAGPKIGTATLCPSCYADCTKKAATDQTGRFTIESLDPKLLFRLLVVAAGHESTFAPKIDPTNGLAKITLKLRSPEEVASSNRISGVVLNERGDPVAGAVIETQGVKVGQVTHWGGTDPYADPVAVADADGLFLLPCRPGVATVHAMAEAQGVAKRRGSLNPGQDHF